jgi:hypothetical protein
MTAIAQKIEQDLKGLPLEDMLLIHEHLLTSIEQREADLPEDYRREIERRIAEIDAGTDKGVDAFEALKKM